MVSDHVGYRNAFTQGFALGLAVVGYRISHCRKQYFLDPEKLKFFVDSDRTLWCVKAKKGQVFCRVISGNAIAHQFPKKSVAAG